PRRAGSDRRPRRAGPWGYPVRRPANAFTQGHRRIFKCRAPRKIAVCCDLCESLFDDEMIRECRMGQLGFFDAEKRLAALSAKGDPLEAIDRLVPWASFRADIEAVVLTP